MTRLAKRLGAQGSWGHQLRRERVLLCLGTATLLSSGCGPRAAVSASAEPQIRRLFTLSLSLSLSLLILLLGWHPTVSTR